MYWEDGQEFAEALEGAFGEEEQELALDWAEKSGLLDDLAAEAEEGDYYEDEGDYYDPNEAAAYVEGEMTAGLEDEMARLERAIGRSLTQKEERTLLESIPSQAWHEGTVPDFSVHADKLKGRATESKESRIALMAEAADSAKARIEEEKPGHDGSEPDWLNPYTEEAERDAEAGIEEGD